MTKRHAKLIKVLRENAEREPKEKAALEDESLEDLQDANDDLVSIYIYDY
jgi:hypothetical protein